MYKGFGLNHTKKAYGTPPKPLVISNDGRQINPSSHISDEQLPSMTTHLKRAIIKTSS